MNKYFIAIIGALVLLSGCEQDRRLPQEVSVRISAEEEILDINAYRFVDGTLAEVFYGMKPESNGSYVLGAEEFKGTVYFTANSGSVKGLGEIGPGTSIDDFLAVTADISEMTSSGIMMTGSTILDRWASQLNIKLERSVARVDIDSPDRGVEVLDAAIYNISETGPAISGAQAATTAREGHIECDFSENPVSARKEMLGYLCAQDNSQIEIRVTVRFGGGIHRLSSRLPEHIKANTVYTVQAFGKGGEVSLTISDDGWENGDSTNTEPVRKASVNPDESEFFPGVTLSGTRDTVNIPHTGGSLKIAIENASGYRIDISGASDDADIRVSEGNILVEVQRKYPGSRKDIVYADIFDGTTNKGRIVLNFMPHPVLIEGVLQFGDGMVCDFGRYIDGELGIISFPDGTDISLETEDEPWAKIDTTSGTWRILAGWKPNDPLADGRTQQAKLVISWPETGIREEYIIRRRNWGLPVVQMEGIWWCKYNLRGNARSFEDQILPGNDPVPDGNLQDYLASCSDEELLDILGDQYQGGNPQGLPLKHDGETFYYEGMSETTVNWANVGDSMTPDGYEIPGFEEFGFYSWNNNSNMGGVGRRPFNNRYGNRMYVNIVERDVDFLGQDYGTVSTYGFEYEDNVWVMCGLGHQWDTTPGNIAKMNIIFATADQSSNSWNMEGYASSVKPGENWFKFTSHNAIKTRTIRCIKSPVEYIY